MERFPVGGSKDAVYDFLAASSYRMSRESDKKWERADGVELHLYGTGSMARIYKDRALIVDAPLAEAVAKADWGHRAKP